MFTRGGTAKSTSRYAVPSRIVLWMRFAVAALVMSAEIKTPPFVAFAAMALSFGRSALPVDFRRRRAFGGSPQVTLDVVTSYPICSSIGGPRQPVA